MIKVIGSILLILGSCGLAVDKVQEEQKKLLFVRHLREFALFLLKEIQYSGTPIPYICKDYEKRAKDNLLLFFYVLPHPLRWGIITLWIDAFRAQSIT